MERSRWWPGREVDTQAHDDFHTVIANPLPWFLQHGMYGLALDPTLTRREHAAWDDGYAAVNRLFADAVAGEVEARGGRALVMLHDYHFYLVGREIRERCPEAVLSFFLHIPGRARTPGGCCPALARAGPHRAARQRPGRLPPESWPPPPRWPSTPPS